MAALTTALIGAGVSLLGSIIGAGVRRKETREAQEEARRLAEIQRKMHEQGIRRQMIESQRQSALQEQQIDLQRANMSEQQQFREQQQSYQMNRQQLNDVLGMVNQSNVMRNQLSNMLSGR